MPTRLRKVKFTRDLLPRVQDFFCGDQQPWETEAAAWIKNSTAESPHDCAVLAVEQCGAQVWLHELEEGTVVGYSSLGPSGWRIPPPNGKRIEISVIPWMAIQKQFWGCPADADAADKYSAYLMDDAIAEARLIQHHDAPYLGLLVHSRNRRAIRVYEKAGFVVVPGIYKDKAAGVEYTRMLLDLTLSADEST